MGVLLKFTANLNYDSLRTFPFLVKVDNLDTPGATVDDLSPQVNIVVPDAGGSASDPLNVIPDEYEEYEDFGIEDSYQANIERD